MRVISNWKNMYKSLAVALPTLAVITLAVMDVAMKTNIIPSAYVPLVVAVSGFIGRIIKQDSL